MRLVLGLFAFFVLILVAQLVRYQVFGLEPAPASGRAYDRNKKLPRGVIVDERGHPLAMDRYRYQVILAPRDIQDKAGLAREIAPLLGMNPVELQTLLEENADSVNLPLGIIDDMEAGETILAMFADDPSITVHPLPERLYPEGSLAAHVLGIVNSDRQGVYGLEGYFDSFLRAPNEALPLIPEKQLLAMRASLPDSLFVPSPVSRDLVLTINRSVQDMVEKALADAIAKHEAESGSAIVMDPRTGAILAMASSPTYDPNKYSLVQDYAIFSNPAISAQYEPGSVFKLITFATALETGVITPETEFMDEDEFVYGERTIRNWDGKGRGRVTATEALVQSLNVTTAKIAVALGADEFYRAVRRFGFGQLTEIELANEIAGQIKSPGREGWYPADLAINSFGQGISVTALQMANAVATIAAGGVRYRPHIVRQIVNEDQVITTRPKPLSRAISAQTAATLTQMMVETVNRIERARIDGYAIAGKSGTAEIPLPGGYTDPYPIASFAGFFPADDPQFVALVKLVRPKTSRWATQTAAPLFRTICEELIRLYSIPPDSIRLAQ